MSYLAPGDLPMQMREGTTFTMNGRSGRIAQNRATDCIIIWDEFTDPKSGEVLPRISSLLSFFELGSALERNQLHILSRPVYRPTGEVVVQELYKRKRSQEERDRAFWRLAFVEAAQELIAEGKMGQRREDFDLEIDAIVGRGNQKQAKRAKEMSGKTKSGFSFTMHSAPTSGTTVYRWYHKFKKRGVASLFDCQSEGGNDRSRYSIEELDLARDVIRKRLNQERASIKNITERVQAVFREENRRRASLPVPAVPLKVLGYDKVWDLIAQIAPVDHEIRTKGMEEAYKDFHVLGLGLQITRALERVEMDVYETDLMMLLSAIGVLDHFTEAERQSLGLDGKPQRVLISGAFDVFTGCIVGIQIALADTTDLAIRTAEMIYLNKQPLADAVGALSPWNMRGHPETIVVDRGNSYIGDEFYMRLSAAGITNLGVPAGKPFLKPWVESWFRTVGAGFMQRFTGRTFSDVVKKGKNDAQARATITLDEFLGWITRWIVDYYHNTKPRTLGKKAPRLAWNDAIAEVPPYAEVDEDQLRIAFGVSKQRNLTRQGFRVANLHYWSDELISIFLTSPWMKSRKLTVHWWAPHIGAITVELPDERSVQAQCTDPKWHGKNYDDLRRYMHEAAQLDDLAQEASDKAIVAIDKFSHDKATLAGLFAHHFDAADLDYLEEKYARYIDIPSRKLPGMIEIFGDEVTPDASTPIPPLKKTDQSETTQLLPSDAASAAT